MAGKRQHYVPRLLQRGFLADPADEGERTWLHRPGVAAKLVGIGDIGVEDWFYSRKAQAGERTLDDAITDYEGDLSDTVRALRETAPGTRVDPVRAAQTLVHLVMRTAHLRRTLSAGVIKATDELEALFTSRERLGAMIGLSNPMLASAVEDAISRNAEELVSAGFPAPLSERLLAFFARESGDQLIEQAIAALTPLFPQLFSGLANKVRETHNTLLEQPLEDHGWVAALSAFTWTIEGASDLLLPDSVALAGEPEGKLAPLLFTSAADAAVVMLPLAPDRLLIGRRDPADPIDISDFNAHAASSCENFFIAARPFDAEALNASIGTGPARELENSIAEALREAETARSSTEGVLPAAQPRQIEQQGFSYRVTLHDFGDDVLAREYGEVLQAVIAPLARDLPLHELDGITIAADYDDALAKLDRGDPELAPVKSGALGYGIGVAKPVTVRREGQRKEHLVVAAGLAEGWISEDPNYRTESLHILITMLAGIAHSTRYAAARDTNFTPDVMGRELHLAVATTPSGYWSAKQAAFVAPDEGERYAELVIDGLEFARRDIGAARGCMEDDSDVGETTQVALASVSAVLGHAADWLGHREGLAEGQPFAGSDLPERLVAWGLDRWIGLFGRDLAACYTEEGAVDLTVVAILSRHVERLFWSLGIYCWPEGEAVRCVVSDRPLLTPQLSGSSVGDGGARC